MFTSEATEYTRYARSTGQPLGTSACSLGNNRFVLVDSSSDQPSACWDQNSCSPPLPVALSSRPLSHSVLTSPPAIVVLGHLSLPLYRSFPPNLSRSGRINGQGGINHGLHPLLNSAFLANISVAGAFRPFLSRVGAWLSQVQHNPRWARRQGTNVSHAVDQKAPPGIFQTPPTPPVAALRSA